MGNIRSFLNKIEDSQGVSHKRGLPGFKKRKIMHGNKLWFKLTKQLDSLTSRREHYLRLGIS